LNVVPGGTWNSQWALVVKFPAICMWTYFCK